ncbi:MAG: ABC transporter ATP-binding protein [Bacteroidota bacterium]
MPTSSEQNTVINICGISKSYALPGDTGQKLVTALENINLDIHKGEIAGIIGPNGSGKSTLLKIISEITAPDSGHIDITGKVASILEVGTGFNPDLTGRENIYLNARLHKMKKKEVDSKLSRITELFGFSRFLDSPVKLYSSGMYMRLAFAIVVNIDADIYLFDEVMSVGDMAFQKQAIEIMKQLQQQNKTIGIVTHAPDQIVEIADRIVLLNQGKLVTVNTPEKVVQYYRKTILDKGKDETLRARLSYPVTEKFKSIYENHEGEFRLRQTSINSNKLVCSEPDASLNSSIVVYFKTSIADKISIGIYFNDQHYNQTLMSCFSEARQYDENAEYRMEITIPGNYFNNFSGYMGILVIRDSRILINYNKLLIFHYSPGQKEPVFKHVSGYVQQNFETKITKSELKEPKQA